MKTFRINQSITNRKDASLEIFFRDVSKLPMITPEREVELARRIKSGDESAVNELVTANLRFVISVAKQYQNKGVDLVDLIQEGSISLIEAAKKWDDTRGYKFISYAVWWIRQAIIKAISDQCRTVKVPLNQIASMSKINKLSEKFEQENERGLSMDEIMEKTNLSKDKINASIATTYRSVSLENPLKDDESNCLLDTIVNDNVEPVDNPIIKNELAIQIEKILSKLPYREQDIVRMSFGIGTQLMSYDEIANRFGIGAERVRQVQHNALKRIKKRYKDKLIELL